MESLPCTIEIAGAISEYQLIQVGQYCSYRWKDSVKFQSRPRSFEIGVEVIEVVSGVVSAVIAAISLCYQIRQTAKEALTVTASETKLLVDAVQKELPSITVLRIEEPEALAAASQFTCRVTVVTGDGKTVDMVLSFNGLAYRIELL